MTKIEKTAAKKIKGHCGVALLGLRGAGVYAVIKKGRDTGERINVTKKNMVGDFLAVKGDKMKLTAEGKCWANVRKTADVDGYEIAEQRIAAAKLTY